MHKVEVVAAIIFSEKKILIAKRKEGKHLAGFWEFPGGKVEFNETPTESLKRELLEEYIQYYCRERAPKRLLYD